MEEPARRIPSQPRNVYMTNEAKISGEQPTGYGLQVGGQIVVIRKSKWFPWPRRAVVTSVEYIGVGVIEFRFRFRVERHRAVLHWNPMLDIEPERYVAIPTELYQLARD
jgi:hypothetical protein